MDTTYSTPISITLHIALCEGRASSEIQLKASEIKALTSCLVNYLRMEVMIKLTLINFILSCMSHAHGFEYSEKLEA